MNISLYVSWFQYKHIYLFIFKIRNLPRILFPNRKGMGRSRWKQQRSANLTNHGKVFGSSMHYLHHLLLSPKPVRVSCFIYIMTPSWLCGLSGFKILTTRTQCLQSNLFHVWQLALVIYMINVLVPVECIYQMTVSIFCFVNGRRMWFIVISNLKGFIWLLLVVCMKFLTDCPWLELQENIRWGAVLICWTQQHTGVLPILYRKYHHVMEPSGINYEIFQFSCRFLVILRNWVNFSTWSETYFRQDLFPANLFSWHQFHIIVIFHQKSISDLDSGSLPRLYGEFMYAKLKIMVSWQRLSGSETVWNSQKYGHQWIGLGFDPEAFTDVGGQGFVHICMFLLIRVVYEHACCLAVDISFHASPGKTGIVHSISESSFPSSQLIVL